jgi:hypothetical protein
MTRGRPSINLRMRRILIIAAFAAATALGSHAQTFSVTHYFTGGSDGGNPMAGLTLDRGGKLYGTTETGTVFRLAPSGSGWSISPIFQFGVALNAPVTFGPDGTLYGTVPSANGIIYNLRPPVSNCRSSSCLWTERQVFFSCCFTFAPGGITFDQEGNFYGASVFEGVLNGCSGGLGCGLIYEMTPVAGQYYWNETALYWFQRGGEDGAHPEGNLIFDRQGNIYSTTAGLYGGDGFGTVFELNRATGWSKTNLFRFPDQSGPDGSFPTGGVVFDQLGNLYGGTTTGGLGGGTVFQLTPSNGSWNYNVIYSFSGSGYLPGVPSNLILGSDGSLYGVTNKDGIYGYGSVFRLTPSNGGWTFASLHDFTGGSDGAYPYGSLVMDSSGTLFGTTMAGGNTGPNCASYESYQCGVVFEITP